MDELLFTPVAVLDFLTQVEELQDLDIHMTECTNGDLQFEIGTSVYELPGRNAANVQVAPSVLEKVEDANQTAYETMESGGTVLLEPIHSGIIKELAKTLLVGGLVRLTNKLMK